MFSDQEIQRVYLSATLKAESEFVRAYGRRPNLIIEPEVDAGNGERTIVNAGKLEDSAQVITWAERKRRDHKLLIAVPSRTSAKLWEPVAKVADRKDFATKLESFRAGEDRAFILAGRFDGIDLPDAICRLMIVSGLPAGGSMLESVLWQQLDMQNLLAARVATRVTQLFGRVIRGRNDYAFFLIQGRDLTTWLNRDRNLALLPELLQKQVKIGESVQNDHEVATFEVVDELIDNVLARDPDWLAYYRQFLDSLELDERDVEKRRKNEEAQLSSALAEAGYAEKMWRSRYSEAATELEGLADRVAPEDSKLAGWLNLWCGAAHGIAGASANAIEQYSIARSRLALDMELPSDGTDTFGISDDEVVRDGDHALVSLARKTARAFTKLTKPALENLSKLNAGLSPGGSEEAFRAAGAVMGFNATRPDNDVGKGPDVLWVDERAREAISFELKTGKKAGTQLAKKDIGQSHDHCEWVAENVPDVEVIRHYIVGRELTVSGKATPSSDWRYTNSSQLAGLIEKYVSDANDARKAHDDAKVRVLKRAMDEGDWSMAAVANALDAGPVE